MGPRCDGRRRSLEALSAEWTREQKCRQARARAFKRADLRSDLGGVSRKLGAQVIQKCADTRGLSQIGVRKEPNRSRALLGESFDEHELRVIPGLRESYDAHAQISTERGQRAGSTENSRRNRPPLGAFGVPNEGGLVSERGRPFEEAMYRVARIAAKLLHIASRSEESDTCLSDLSSNQVFRWILSDTHGHIGLVSIQAGELIAQMEIEGDGGVLSLKLAEESAHSLRDHFCSGDTQSPFDPLVMTRHPPLQCLDAPVETRT